jgi:hypothetical protein
MKFLDSIGTAQMEQEMERKVLDIAKKNLETMMEESRVQPTIGEDDMKDYLHEVLQEVKTSRKRQ